MRFRKDENGQMIVMLAVSFSMLMVCMAFAVDVGILFHVRREVQIAADAAAMAGALDYHYNTSQTSATSAALNAACLDGVAVTGCPAPRSSANCAGNPNVCVAFPPASQFNSPFGAGFVQAAVTVPNPTPFMSLFHITSLNVAASAVAGPGASQGCIWTLSGAGKDIGGSGNLTAAGCEIYDNSSSGNALDLAGGRITAKQVGVTGGAIGSVNPTAIRGMVPVKDPLASLAVPSGPTGSGIGCVPPPPITRGFQTFGANCYTGNFNILGGLKIFSSGNHGINGNINVGGSGSVTFDAGSHFISGNLAHSGSGTVTLSSGSYTIGGTLSNLGAGPLNLSSGQYIVNGGLDFTGTGLVNGPGVSFYTAGASTLAGTMTLTAPTAGAENGILIFQAAGDTSQMTILESGNMTFKGIVYAPSAQLGFGGSGSGNVYADFVVGSLNITGAPILQNYAFINHGTPLTKIVMVQ